MKKPEVRFLQHLGIVAGMCREIGIAEQIDERINKPKRKVSVGKAVEAMILNALGFSGRALYLTPEFYKHRPVDVLLDSEIEAKDLHDDCLGTALDALYEYGVTELFYQVAGHAVEKAGLPLRFVHLDSTTMSFHGQYKIDEEEQAPEAVSITKGYSKDRAPDLNQVVVSLMCTYRSSIPVWLEVLSGNANDKVSFRKSIQQYREQLRDKQLPYFVADSALYSAEGLQELGEVRWVTRVPETLKEAKEQIAALNLETMTECDHGYRIKEVNSRYASVSQRWVLVYSQQAREREMKTFEKTLVKRKTKREKELWHLCNQSFACEADARKAVEKFSKSLRFHTAAYRLQRKLEYGKKGRPGKTDEAIGEKWFIDGMLENDEDAIETAKKSKGVFILATNILDETELRSEQILEVYKGQGVSVERGFRFLKDPMFYAESLYLNSPKRIMALIMVMSLSLLVYSLAERKLRTSMKKQKVVIPNQVGKPTDNPTIRRVFQIFEYIALTYYGDTAKYEVSNLDDVHETLLTALGPPFRKIYFLA